MWLWLVVWLLCVGSASAQTGPRGLVLHAAGTTGNGAVLNTVGYSTVAVAVAGVAAGADLVIQFEGSVDGTNYTALKCREMTANTLASTSTASGTTLTQWSCPVAGLQKFRTPISGGSTGAVNVTASALPQVSWIPPPAAGGGGGSGDALTTDPLSQFASTTSAQLAGVISNETGSGALVFATSPTLVTPLLGTPTSGVLTNATGLPITTGVSGLGANVATWLASPTTANFANAVTGETGTGAVVFATSPTLVTPTLGAANVTSLTFATGTQVLLAEATDSLSLRRGTNAQTLNIYETFTDASNYSRLNIVGNSSNIFLRTQYAGTGDAVGLALGTNNTTHWLLVADTGHLTAATDNTYDIGASGASRPRTGYFATSVIAPVFTASTGFNKVAITAPASSATLTIADGKTLTASNTLTFTGTDASSVDFGTGGTVAYTSGGVTSITGTANQVIASASTGAVTLSTPQSIATASTPQFAALGLGNAAGASGLIITSALSTCLTVGPNGTTTPTLSMDCSVTNAANGLQIVPTASGSGVTLQTTGGTNEGLTVKAKGSSTVTLGGAGGTVTLSAATASSTKVQTNAGTRLEVFQNQLVATPNARTSGVTTVFSFTGAADTALTTATEAKDFLIDLSQTKQHASNGTIALQRHINFLPGTDTCASATCTITEDALLALTGPPTGGTNSAITQSESLLIETRALTNVTNGFGLVVNAPSAASGKNYAAKFTGDVVVAGHLQAGSAIGAVSSCGTSASVAGADTAFRVTVGTTVTTSSCTIAFGTAFPTAPICVANDETATLLIKAVPTTTQVVLSTATAFQNDVIGVMCRGYE